MEETQASQNCSKMNVDELETLSKALEEQKQKLVEQETKMQELERIKGKQGEMIVHQGDKWGKLMSKLEKDYQEKIHEFEEIL